MFGKNKKQKQNSKEKIIELCSNCQHPLEVKEITVVEMIQKLKKLTELKNPVAKNFQLKIEDFDNKDKEKKIYDYAMMMLKVYDYLKCPKCGWGMLGKKSCWGSPDKNIKKLITDSRKKKSIEGVKENEN